MDLAIYAFRQAERQAECERAMAEIDPAYVARLNEQRAAMPWLAIPFSHARRRAAASRLVTRAAASLPTSAATSPSSPSSSSSLSPSAKSGVSGSRSPSEWCSRFVLSGGLRQLADVLSRLDLEEAVNGNQNEQEQQQPQKKKQPREQPRAVLLLPALPPRYPSP